MADPDDAAPGEDDFDLEHGDLQAALGDLLAGSEFADPADEDDAADDAGAGAQDDLSPDDDAPAARAAIDEDFDLAALEDAVAELGIDVGNDAPELDVEEDVRLEMGGADPEATGPSDQDAAPLDEDVEDPFADAGAPYEFDLDADDEEPQAADDDARSGLSAPTGRHVGLDLTELPAPSGRPAQVEPEPYLLSSESSPQEDEASPEAPEVAADDDTLDEVEPPRRAMPPLGQASAADLFGEDEDDEWDLSGGLDFGRAGVEAAVPPGPADAGVEAEPEAAPPDEDEATGKQGLLGRLRAGRRRKAEAQAEAEAQEFEQAILAAAHEASAEGQGVQEPEVFVEETPDPTTARSPWDLDDPVTDPQDDLGGVDEPERADFADATPAATGFDGGLGDLGELGVLDDDPFLDLDDLDDLPPAPLEDDEPRVDPVADEVVAFAAHRGRLSGNVSAPARKLFGR